jgi:hypothetical protein
MNHTKDQILLKARCLAQKILNVAKGTDEPCKYEIDLLVQDAQYVLLDTQHLEALDNCSRTKVLETLENGKAKLPNTLDGTLYARGEH